MSFRDRFGPDLQWNPHVGSAQKARHRRQFIRPILKSKDPETVRVRDYLEAISEDREEFELACAFALHEAKETDREWWQVAEGLCADGT